MPIERNSIERGEVPRQQHRIEPGDEFAPRIAIARGDTGTRRAPKERVDGPARLPAPAAEPAVGDLIRQLGTDSAALVRNEVALAKLEMRDMVRDVALDSAKLFGALALALAGMLTLLAALTIAVGDALDGRYALAALIVGAVTLAIGGLLARAGMTGLKQDHAPDRTAASLRTTRQWARNEIREFKDEIRS